MFFGPPYITGPSKLFRRLNKNSKESDNHIDSFLSSRFSSTNLYVRAAVEDEHCLSCSRLVKNLRTQKTGLVPPTVLQSTAEEVDLYSNSGTTHQSQEEQQKGMTDITTLDTLSSD